MKMKLFAAAAATAAIMSAVGVAQAEDLTEIRIGILGGENASDRLKAYTCLEEKVEALMGVEASVFAPADYSGVIEGLLGGNLDLAWLGASGYAAVYIADPEAVEPVLVKVNTDGSYGYYSIGFARVDSGITSLDDMKEKVFAFGDPNSTSGYLIPSIEIPQKGYSMKPGEYFKDIKFSGGHEQTIVGVFNGDYDGGVTWADGLGTWEEGFNSGALRKATDAGLVDMTEIREIWRSDVIPEGPFVVRKSLPEDAKVKLTGLLASLPSMDPDCAYGVLAGDAKGLAPITHKAYVSVIEARKAKIKN
ncbi:phosphonate ABC transporter substrate-binding protein [Rhodospirillaceae bacterium KN72]|uniref:Phosphonate ABC transporter substrate-binding protein n=1 Tax=Pacificispira spongiicola TaxID=2729598 RepID=A0A7Y0HFT9_9PROT|nr:phosphonate ABC transporter substrate-binding protein [Pacificispira spongiicola]NMM44242.1 phosphonate ABC transporter substrate-binding protein [Pacificispira spongiicola]